MLEEQLKQIVLDQYGSISKFAEACKMPYGTVDTVFRRGLNKAGISTIIGICKTLNISADELAKGNIVYNYDLKDSNTDLELLIERLRASGLNLVLDNRPLSKDEESLILDAVEIAVGMIKKRR